VTLASILLMPFTFYLSAFLYQAYPDEIVIYVDDDNLPESREEKKSFGSTESYDGGSAWEKPIF